MEQGGEGVESALGAERRTLVAFLMGYQSVPDCAAY